MNSDDELTGYLNQVHDMVPAPEGWRYGALEQFILEHGIKYIPAVRPSSVARMPSRECYANSYCLATGNPRRYRYVEGFALCQGIPFGIEHAWVLDMQTDTVIDPTWEPVGVAYRGVALSQGFCDRIMLKTGHYGVLDGARLLRFFQFPFSEWTRKAEELHANASYLG